MVSQRTLKNTIRATGIGVHSGEKVYLTLKPAPVDTGILFRRVDCNPVVEIPAKVNYVGNTSFCTTLVKDSVKISTIEHLLSALSGLGIDNVYVDISASEVPIMDGSSSPFVFLIQSAGIVEQEAPKKYLRVLKTVEVREGDKWARLEPFNGFKVDFSIDYDHPAIQSSGQRAQITFSLSDYTKEISRARTYGFLSDFEWLRSSNLALGASLENAIVLDESRVLNEDGLRFKDEFVRHKVLDAVGDLYLFGYSLMGAFYGYKSGHALNNKLSRALLDDTSAWDIVTSESMAVAS